jgi:carbamoyl-phosphate synthase large subunit
LKRAVLITSAGRRVGLMSAVRESLAELGLDWRIIAADAEPDLSAACALADEAHRVPPISAREYVDTLLDICRTAEVGLLIPTIDPELLPISLREKDFASEGVGVNIGTGDFVRIARDKALTAESLKQIGVEAPHTWTGDGEQRFPAIAKPVDGSASVGIRRYRSAEEYRSDPPSEGCILQELLEGPEYTVNVFCDSAGAFRCAVPHRRLEVRAGEVSKGRTERRDDLTDIARRIASLPCARGAFCFQVIDTDRGPVVFEINARFGGGYPLAHRAGGKFVKWLLEEATGKPSTAADDWQDGLLMLRYDSEVFVP